MFFFSIICSEEVFLLYRISYMWYTVLGVGSTLVVGLVVSFLTGARNPKEVDPMLLTPVIHRFLPKKLPVEPVKIALLGKETSVKTSVKVH